MRAVIGRPVVSWSVGESCRGRTGVPLIGGVGNDVAARTVVGRVHSFVEVEVEHARVGIGMNTASVLGVHVEVRRVVKHVYVATGVD